MNKLCLIVLFISVSLFLCSSILFGMLLYHSWNTSVIGWVFNMETGCEDGKTNYPVKNAKVCCSQACEEASIGILSQINRNKDPCESFYEYACGNTIIARMMEFTTKKESSIPYTQNKIYTIVLQQIRNFLQDETVDTLSTLERSAKHYYKSCRKWLDSQDSTVNVATLIQDMLEPEKLSDYYVQTLKENPSCEEIVIAAFPVTMHAVLYRNRNGEKSKQYLMQLVQDFRNQLQDAVINSWMQQSFNSSVVQMINTLIVNVGIQPELIERLRKVDDELSHTVNITDELLDNFVDMTKDYHKYQTMSLIFAEVYGLMLNKSASLLTLSSGFPVIIVPESKYLVGFYFHRDYPDSVNIGRLGSVLGHEFIHTMDMTRMQNLSWNPDVNKEYYKRAQCYVDQYSKFMIGSKYVNGTFTLDENISDNEGLKIAYKVYKERKEDLTIPRMGNLYSQDQLFFISYAQTKCSTIQSFVDHMSIDIDSHSPLYYRVQGPLTNMPEFSAAFNCPVKSKYNPGDERCGIF